MSFTQLSYIDCLAHLNMISPQHLYSARLNLPVNPHPVFASLALRTRSFSQGYEAYMMSTIPIPISFSLNIFPVTCISLRNPCPTSYREPSGLYHLFSSASQRSERDGKGNYQQGNGSRSRTREGNQRNSSYAVWM